VNKDQATKLLADTFKGAIDSMDNNEWQKLMNGFDQANQKHAEFAMSRALVNGVVIGMEIAAKLVAPQKASDDEAETK
jgi:hypothetical protein